MSTAAAPVTSTPAERVAIAGPAQNKRKVRPATVVAYVLLSIIAITWLMPVLWATLTAFKPETEAAGLPVTIVPESGFTTGAFEDVLAAGLVPRWAFNSLLTASATTFITLVVSSLAGYALSRMNFPGKNVSLGVIVASILIPAQIIIVPLFEQMVDFNMLDTYWAIILPQVVAAPMVFILKRFFDAIPRDLEEAAMIDGASRMRIFLQIILPLSRPILAAVAIFVFIQTWNNFLWPFIAITDPEIMTLPVGLQTVISAYGIQYAQVMAQAVLAALPLIVAFIFFQRQIIKGIATSGITGT
ncbi:carbohydrate ABC transporter permease [Georgenia halophila]|uniref:Carbohydrate ABC transporter permease n=1 Tax=Georgenia halophila TaxID=620889 RepID=A0ABP8L6C9_9MICO